MIDCSWSHISFRVFARKTIAKEDESKGEDEEEEEKGERKAKRKSRSNTIERERERREETRSAIRPKACYSCRATSL